MIWGIFPYDWSISFESHFFGALTGFVLAETGVKVILGSRNLNKGKEALEKLSKQYYFCILSKKLKKLNKKEMNEVLKIFTSYKSKD